MLGAKWDSIASKWYIQLDGITGKCAKTGNAISAFARWDPRIPKTSVSAPLFTSPEGLQKKQVIARSMSSSDSSSSSDVSPKRKKVAKKKVMKVSSPRRSIKTNKYNEEDEDSCGETNDVPVSGNQRKFLAKSSLHRVRSKGAIRVKDEEDLHTISDNEELLPSEDEMPPSKKQKLRETSVDEDADSFIVEDEELSPSDAETLLREKVTIGKRCYGCRAVEVPHVCSVSDCFKDACVMHVIICKYCKKAFCNDHGKSRQHDCNGQKK